MQEMEALGFISGARNWKKGSFPTSYIPTTAAAVTRAAEALSMPTGAWFDATKGTMKLEVYRPSYATGTFDRILTLGNAAENNRLVLYTSTNGQLQYSNNIGGVGQFVLRYREQY